MTSATSTALQEFWAQHSFVSFTRLSLIAVAVLVIAVIEQEVFRSLRPAEPARTARVLAIVIQPFSVLAVALIVTRFIHLA